MLLVPALKVNGKIHKGTASDSHVSLGERLSLAHEESNRGFSPDGKVFFARFKALGFLKTHEPETYKKLDKEAFRIGLHSEHLANARGIKQTQRAKEEAKNEDGQVDLSTKTVLVVDRGAHTYCAEELAKKFKKVYFCLSDEDPYPNSAKAAIATGFKGVQRVASMWDWVDKVDLICFFDTNYADKAHYLREHGYRVFGSGKGEIIELDKVGFLETLEKLGLPCPKTYIAEGIDDALEYLEAHKDETLFLKCKRRGDFESKKFTSMPQIKLFFQEMRKRLGTAAETTEILIQHTVESEVEAGIDTMTADGQYVSNAIIGIEGKDKCFIAQIFKENPKILQDINDAFSGELKKLGFRGNYSTEVRITADGVAVFIDPTPRQPEPPGALFTMIYENWAECLWAIAEGNIPVPKVVSKFGAQYILTSWWYNENEMHVEVPKKYRDYLKLKNHKVVDGEIFVVPNQNGEFWGSIVAAESTIEKSIAKIKEVAESIKADGFHFEPSCFDGIMDSASKAKKFGINFEF